MRRTSKIVPQGQRWPQGRPAALPPGASRPSRYNCSAYQALLLLLAAGGLKVGGRAGLGCDWLWRFGEFAHVTVAFDGSHHALAIPGDPGIAYVARPRINHVGRRVDFLGVSSAEGNGVLALKILLKGIIPRQRETTNNGGLTGQNSGEGTDFQHGDVTS